MRGEFEFVVFLIAIISLSLHVVGRSKETKNTNIRSIMYGGTNYPERFWKFDYLAFMMINALIAMIFCVWTTIIYIPKVAWFISNIAG